MAFPAVPSRPFASTASPTGERVRGPASGHAIVAPMTSVIQPPNTARAWAIELALCAAVGAVLGVIGPFGTFFNDSLAVLVAYWSGLSLISGVFVGVGVRLVWPRAQRRGMPVWAWLPVVAALVTVVPSVLSRIVATALWSRVPENVGWPEWYGQGLLIEAIYISLYVLAYSRIGAARMADPGDPRILERLPPRLGRDLLCLQMEDHYVRLHTPEGSVLVLTSLGRALEEIGDIEGMQVHRSWWVARRAVQGVVHDGRKLRLRLTGGLEAPVARSQVARLRAAGWLEAE